MEFNIKDYLNQNQELAKLLATKAGKTFYKMVWDEVNKLVLSIQSKGADLLMERGHLSAREAAFIFAKVMELFAKSSMENYQDCFSKDIKGDTNARNI